VSKKKLKVAVCVPSGDMVHTNFALSLVNMVAYSTAKGIHVGIVNVKNSLLPLGRSDLVKHAMQINADKILFLDSDMVFPSDTLMRLLAHEKDIVCTDAMRRTEPFSTVVKKNKNNDRINYAHAKPLEEIEGVSTGVLLVDIKVFKKIGMPYFNIAFDNKLNKFTGEDYHFGYKCKKLGYTLYCDTKLSKYIGHIGATCFYIKQIEQGGPIENKSQSRPEAKNS
jgi:hypothetical protein